MQQWVQQLLVFKYSIFDIIIMAQIATLNI